MRYREPEIETHYIKIKDEGLVYTIQFEVAVRCLQQGTYSTAALDPDEYFGVYHHDLLDITHIEVYDEETDENWDLEPEDLPDWMIREVELEVDRYN